ncbi:MAG: 1-deoxy-D-xylulose-5-phosphate synthase [Bacteroidota bacterium]
MAKHFDGIDSPHTLKTISRHELTDFAAYLRNYLIERIAEQGGHFAANLGTIELTIALHYIFHSPEDKMVWDVGHQAYAHKILTGRKHNFDTLRKLGGLSGFPKMSESNHDAFGTAHSSTSISAVLGYAVAARLQGIQRQHIAIIGDGALSAGQAFEALNNAAIADTNITIIINDNHIGIDPSQGALGEYLEQLEYKQDNLFTDFGFQYFGPVDGHNIEELLTVFERTATIQSPKVIHVKTIKGKGYKPAEEEQTKWHSTSQFDKLSGKSLVVSKGLPKYQDIFGKTLLRMAEDNPHIVAVTPAMVSGSSLHFMQDKFPERVFDVGIAEQHALTFSAGLAASGLRPFCCIYSTFLQRAYDQLIHDIALQNLPVVLAIDRSGLVGEDGPTHHGVFDIAFLQTVPNMVILSPRNGIELQHAVYTAALHLSSPIAIRYPRGTAQENTTVNVFKVLPVGKAERLQEGKRLCIISHGSIAKECSEAIRLLKNKAAVGHYDFKYIKPLDTETLDLIFKAYEIVVTVEEGQLVGGLGSTVALYAEQCQYPGRLVNYGLADTFTTQGSPAQLLHLSELDSESLYQKIDYLLS